MRLDLKSADELRELSRFKLAERALDQGLAAKLAAGGDRIVTRHNFSGQLFDPQPAEGAEPNCPAARASRAADGPDICRKSLDHRSLDDRCTAVKQALAAYRGQPLAGILIATDGQSNSGDPLSKANEAAAAEGVPLVALALGTPEGPRNAAITKIDVSPVVFVRDTNQAHVIVNSRGLNGQPANVILERQPDGGVGRNRPQADRAGRIGHRANRVVRFQGRSPREARAAGDDSRRRT